MSDERQTVAGAYLKIDAHEAVCAERYARINDTLADLKGAAKGHERAAWSIAIAVIAWALVQLYNDHRPAAPAAPTVVAAVAAPPAGK